MGVNKDWHKQDLLNKHCLVPIDADGTCCDRKIKGRPLDAPDDWEWGRLCQAHLLRWKAHKDLRVGTPIKRCKPYGWTNMTQTERVFFWLSSKNEWVLEDEKTGCLLWQGALNFNGYSETSMTDPEGINKTGRVYLRVHRMVYDVMKGGIPEDAVIHHTCGVRHCINPDHLEAVTQSENNAERHRNVRLKRENDHLRAEVERLQKENRRLRDGVEIRTTFSNTGGIVTDS